MRSLRESASVTLLRRDKYGVEVVTESSLGLRRRQRRLRRQLRVGHEYFGNLILL